jgi:hypothetical protein
VWVREVCPLRIQQVEVANAEDHVHDGFENLNHGVVVVGPVRGRGLGLKNEEKGKEQGG